jgi:IclR family mhp operon transcriptional activator
MRSLARGLEVLDYVARGDGVTFTDICKATALPKSVVHRIVAELVSSGHVWRGHAEADYFASGSMAVVPKGASAQALKRSAVEPLDRLVEEVRWPSDLFVRQGSTMILIDTTRPKSPFELRWSRIGRRVPILLSSVGRAALSAMSENEQEKVYADLRRRGEWRRQFRRCSAPLDQIIQQTIARGYAIREPRFDGEQLERSGIYSIAAPILVRNDVVGALNVWWPTSADRGMRLPKRHLDALRHAAAAIGDNMAATTSTPAPRRSR